MYYFDRLDDGKQVESDFESFLFRLPAIGESSDSVVLSNRTDEHWLSVNDDESMDRNATTEFWDMFIDKSTCAGLFLWSK